MVSASSPLKAAEKSIVSGVTSPAIHGVPVVSVEAVFVLAAVIASRRVHWPSSAVASPVLVTVIVAAEALAAQTSSRPTASNPAFSMRIRGTIPPTAIIGPGRAPALTHYLRIQRRLQ